MHDWVPLATRRALPIDNSDQIFFQKRRNVKRPSRRTNLQHNMPTTKKQMEVPARLGKKQRRNKTSASISRRDTPLNAPDNWMFFHDALSLMTAESCKLWMERRGILKHWILPECGLHQDQPGLKDYWHRPVGNSPELMPWDCSLNKDLQDAV